jgi:creatinine amidohydrolase
MRWIIAGLAATCALAAASLQASLHQPAVARSHRLEQLSWYDASGVLKRDTVVVIPLGAAAKEHGPHLKLSNDAILAEHLTTRVASATSVVVAPALTYHYYPAFLEYPGSTSLSLNTARDLTLDVIRSLARHGPRRFYALNTGISTLRPLTVSAEALAREGILLRYTNLESRLESAVKQVSKQEGGSHADEIETSMMLHIDPHKVDMSKAVKDYGPRSTPFALTRTAGGTGTYSPTGIWGDPTLANAQKGWILVEALVAGIVEEINALRTAALPVVTAPAPPPEPSSRSTRTTGDQGMTPGGCSPGDERSIRAIGDAFTAHWTNADADRLAGLWADQNSDIVHPDGMVERGRKTIAINRAELFRRREYRHSRHPLQLGVIRCLTNDIAVADGKWELRDVLDTTGKGLRTVKGLCTLVVKRSNAGWLIEAYRYTIDGTGPPLPMLLKRPGYPGRVGEGPSQH